MTIPEISKAINENAKIKGFWDNGIDLPTKLLLIHSEISEAMEADRINKHAHPAKYLDTLKVHPDRRDKIFESEIKHSFEDELADTVIRVFDLAYQLNIDLETHILMKHDYNTRHPYKHGKKY